MNNMTEEERKRYFGILVENLYSKLQIVSEGTVQNKKEIATKLIHDFYKEYKNDYGIENIEEIIRELDRVNENIKKSRGQRESNER